MFYACNNLTWIKFPANLVTSVSLPSSYQEWDDLNGDWKEGEYPYHWKNEKDEVVTKATTGLSSPMVYTRHDNIVNPTPANPTPVKVTKLTITAPSTKVAAGKSIQLTAQILPDNAENKSVTWESSDPKVATVTETGKVSISKKAAGKTVTITATAKDGSGVKASCQIKVMKDSVKKIKLSASSKTVKAGGKLKIKAEVTTTGKTANKKLMWTSSNPDYATVSASGVVKATKAGKGKTVTITAEATDGSGKKAKMKIKIK